MPNQHKTVIVSKLPDCDYCKSIGITKKAKYDAKTYSGPWANLCEYHFRKVGIGLGLGKGQELILDHLEK